METISFDSGLREYRLGEGVLRFNPGDPNVYARFARGAEKLRQVEQEFTASKEELFDALQEADGQMKRILGWIFGEGNDFNQMLGGVNLLAVAENGERLVTNLFEALEPILVEGAERCAGAQAEEAARKAEARRSGK